MQEPKIDAADVLNWQHLCETSEKFDPNEIRTFGQAMQLFAYDFTSTADAQAQNEMLSSLLRRACFKQSVESCEDVVRALALALRSDLGQLREHARRIGIRLRKT